jgi:RND family efflux transporter MFP subunit
VTVKTAPLRKATITETITAYGTVVSEAGEVEVVSVPYEARVRRVQAAPGQRVAAGSALLEVAPSAGTALQLRQARASVDAAAKQLRETEERYRANLATNQELFAAEANLRSGRAGLEGLEKGGAGAPQRLTTGVSGIVSILNVRVGQTVPAGNALLEIVSEDHIEVQLGVEPEALPRLRVGQPVTLSSVHSGSPANVPGKIRLVTQRVNPATRLVDVFVSTPQGTDLLLGAYVRGTLTTASKGALVVPREAALPEGQEHVLFSVKDQRAVKHVVALGLENDREVEVLGSDLQAGQEVVVSGNYELRDGMAVTLETASPAMRTPAVSPAPKADP